VFKPLVQLQQGWPITVQSVEPLKFPTEYITDNLAAHCELDITQRGETSRITLYGVVETWAMQQKSGSFFWIIGIIRCNSEMSWKFWTVPITHTLAADGVNMTFDIKKENRVVLHLKHIKQFFFSVNLASPSLSMQHVGYHYFSTFKAKSISHVRVKRELTTDPTGSSVKKELDLQPVPKKLKPENTTETKVKEEAVATRITETPTQMSLFGTFLDTVAKNHEQSLAASLEGLRATLQLGGK